MNTQTTNATNKSLYSHIKTFKPIIDELVAVKGNENILIAGSFALQLHGLKLSREPNDLDIVIFKPSEKQVEVLKRFDLFNQIKTNFEDDYKKWRIKLVKDNHELDILIEETEPNTELYYHYVIPDEIFEQTFSYRVQSIKGVIDAKRTYIIDDPGKLSPSYARLKDCKDIVDLKNLNFNL